MATHVEVVCTNLKRLKIKVTPGTYMIDVLNEACEKSRLESSKYSLKQKQRTIDLTSPFRNAGLSPGAKLEMVLRSSSPTAVSIKVEVVEPDSTGPARSFMRKLPSNMTLWQALRQVEDGETQAGETKVRITDRGTARMQNRPLAGVKGSGGGQLFYVTPVVSVNMGKEYMSPGDLNKTLSQCGVAGNSKLRVTFRDTETPIHEALDQISRFLKGVEEPRASDQAARPKPGCETKPELSVEGDGPKDVFAMVRAAATNATSSRPDVITAEAALTVDEAGGQSMNVDSPVVAADISESSASSSPRDPLLPTAVFSAPSSAAPAATRVQEDDSVYEPTIAHMQLRQQHLQQRSQNTRLKSDTELAAAAAAESARAASIKEVTIKVRFPKNTSATWTATQEHTGAFIHQAVRGIMRHPDQKFKLLLPGVSVHGALATAIEDSENIQLIAGYKLRGNTLLNLVWDDSVPARVKEEPFLKEAIAKEATDIVIPEVPDAKNEEPASSSQTAPDTMSKRQGDAGSAEAKLSKLSKLLKLPGKR